MTFHQPDQVRYLTFDSFDENNIVQGIFTRIGGQSPFPWQSLNVGGTVGDAPERVRYNRELVFQTINCRIENSFDVWQTHGNEVICVESPRTRDQTIKQADAIVTDKRGVVLFMRFADCVPILLYDPVRSAIGMVHAGWKGTAEKVVERTLQIMQKKYHSDPKNIIAGIGPSIAAHHYEVGSEVIQMMQNTFGSNAVNFMTNIDGANPEKVYLDLWGANTYLLEGMGVRNIENPKICTACNLSEWYSHRGDKGKTGRFAALLGLN